MPDETSDELSRHQQRVAIEHDGQARLLAGPGTGKTWTLKDRVVDLVQRRGVLPTQILALSFTRAAAEELRTRFRDAFGPDAVLPRVSTLHSYSMRQLIRNSDRYTTLPQPIRVADDWEQRWVIEEDLKAALEDGGTIRDVRDLLNQLSADWHTMRADQEGWEQEFPDPEFIGQWRHHRMLYGYTLRSELVYQLKKALEQHGDDLDVDNIPAHLLVDEFQDLNPCDLWIVTWLRERGAIVFAAGDDDQSIYGFRKAYPLGIRRFTTDVPGAADLRLEVCKRCDAAILRLGDFIIRTDPGRVPKALRAEDGRPEGEVQLVRLPNQRAEAEAIAEKCRQLIDGGLAPKEILILLRQDRNGVMSAVLTEALRAREVPVHVEVGDRGPFDTADGRRLLAVLRLVAEKRDSLAWRTLLRIDPNRLGAQALGEIHGGAAGAGQSVADLLLANAESPRASSALRRVATYTEGVLAEVEAYREAFDFSTIPPDERSALLRDAILGIEPPASLREPEHFAAAQRELARVAEVFACPDLATLLGDLGTAKDDEEQVIDPDAVNVLTMHKAKGLGADTVFIPAVEDEYMPGRAETADEIADERRLFYVAITRAQHRLCLTYCSRRDRAQLHSGRTAGNPQRSLTRFLRDTPLVPTATIG